MLEFKHHQERICLEGLTNGHNVEETVMFLKGYILGFLGIPFGNQCWGDIMERVEEYGSWIKNSLISLKEYVKTVNAAILAVRSHHNRPTNDWAYAKTAHDFMNKLASLIVKVRENPQFYKNQPCQTYANQDYSHLNKDWSIDEGYAQCSICNLQLKPDHCFELDCEHTFHRDCLCEHVRAKIQDREDVISCPQQNCNVGMQGRIMSSILPPELNERYSNLLLSKYIERNRQTTSCCPTPNCSVVFQYDKDIRQFKCFSCNKSYCLSCKCPFHENISCEEYQQIMNMNEEEEERNFVLFAHGAKFKQCPHCKHWVERTQGCPTMKCRCSRVFCYNCGGTNCPHGRCSSAN